MRIKGKTQKNCLNRLPAPNLSLKLTPRAWRKSNSSVLWRSLAPDRYASSGSIHMIESRGKIRIEKGDKSLVISIRWLHRSPFATAIFLVISVLLSISIAKSGCPGVFFIIPIIGLYISLTLFLNTTQIKIDTKNIEVIHGPLPSPARNGSLTLDSKISIRWIIREHEPSEFSDIKVQRYELRAMSSLGDSLTLIKAGTSRYEFLPAASEIEKFLISSNSGANFGEDLTEPYGK